MCVDGHLFDQPSVFRFKQKQVSVWTYIPETFWLLILKGFWLPPLCININSQPWQIITKSSCLCFSRIILRELKDTNFLTSGANKFLFPGCYISWKHIPLYDDEFRYQHWFFSSGCSATVIQHAAIWHYNTSGFSSFHRLKHNHFIPCHNNEAPVTFPHRTSFRNK